ncbi:unnamed protein product [Malus baccata var. baccata]
MFFSFKFPEIPRTLKTLKTSLTGEGITTVRSLLNALHHPRAVLHTELFFEEGGVHFLGPAWTSQVLKWFTPNPFRAKSGISSSKWLNHSIFPCIDIDKHRLLHNFCFLDHFIIIGVCFGINYHNLVGFRINVKDLGKTCGRRFCYEGKDYRGVF